MAYAFEADPAAGSFPGLDEAQAGAIGEDRVATAISVQAPGSAVVAYPLLDGGFDLYLRRIGTMRVHPLQVKARTFLEADGRFQVGVPSLLLDPRGYVVFPYIPPPAFELDTALWAVPIPEFIKIAQPHDNGWLFSGYLDARLPSAANEFLMAPDRLLTQWLHRIPGWTAPVPSAASSPGQDEARAESVARPADRAFGRFAELWLASELMRVGLQDLVLAQDRLRVDCVSFLLHHLPTFSVRGLVVHAATINRRGIAEFRIRRDTFFVDPRLDVALLVCSDEPKPKLGCLVPSSAIPALSTHSADRGDPGYQLSFRVDPLAEKWRPYAVQPDVLAVTILARFGA